MPPKKVEAPPPPKEDTNPYGVFVNFAIPSATVQGLEHPDGLNKLHITITYPGDFAPLNGEHAEPAEGGFYALNFSKRFRREAGLDALHGLLNSTTTIGLVHSATGTLMASAAVDMLPFGLGEQSFSLSNFKLKPVAHPTAPPPATPATTPPKGAPPPPPPPAAPVPLDAPPVLPSVTISLTQRLEPEAGSPEAEAAAAAIAAYTAAVAAAGSRAATPAGGAKPAAPAAAGKGKEAAPAAPAAPVPEPAPPKLDEAALPPMQPFRYLPEEEAATANVVQLEVKGPTGAALPPGLVAAMDAAAGKLSVMATLALPAPGPALTLVGGAVVREGAAGGGGTAAASPAASRPVSPPKGAAAAASAGGAAAGAGAGQPALVWPGGSRMRRVLPAAAAAALADHLDADGQLWVEVARYMGEDKALGDSQTAWTAYHARAMLQGADALLEGGEVSLPPSLPSASSPADGAAATPGGSSGGAAPAGAPEAAHGPGPYLSAPLAVWPHAPAEPAAVKGATKPQSGASTARGVSASPAGSTAAAGAHPAGVESTGAHHEYPPSALPDYVAPAAKFKPVEEVTQDVADGAGAWAAAGSALQVRLTFARPLLPPWKAPAPPAKDLQAVCPRRDLNPAPPPPTAQQEMDGALEAVLKQLAGHYLTHLKENPEAFAAAHAQAQVPGPGQHHHALNGHEETASVVSAATQQTGSAQAHSQGQGSYAPSNVSTTGSHWPGAAGGAGAGGAAGGVERRLQGRPAGAPPPEKVHAHLIYELNASGAYEGMLDSLKAPLVALVKERFGRSGSMGPVDMSATYGPLYTALRDSALTVVNRAARAGAPRPPPVPEPPPSAEELAALLERAQHAEAAGDLRRSAALLARRLLDKNNLQVHLDAAMHAARNSSSNGSSSKLGLAAAWSHCMSALEIDPGHASALAVTACIGLELHLQQQRKGQQGQEEGGASQPQPNDAYEGALAAAHALLAVTAGVQPQEDKEVQAVQSLAWALLASIYGAGAGASAAADAAACLTELRRRERLALRALAPAADAAAGAGSGGSGEGAPATAAAAPAGAADSGYATAAAEGAQGATGSRAGSSAGAALDTEGAPAAATAGAEPGAEAPASSEAAPLVSGPLAEAIRCWCAPEGSTGAAILAQPCLAAGVLPLWGLALQLGLRGVAEQAQALARGRLSRSTTHEPLEVLLLSARTLVLPPLQPAAAPQQQQPSELQAGGSGGDGADAAAVASAEGEQSGEGAAAEAAATGEEAVAAGGEEEQQPGVSNARAAELAQAADLLKRARRMVAAPAAGAAGEGASAPAAAAAAPDLRPVLLEGDLAWAKSLFVGGREAGSEGAGDWEAEREAKTTARAKYQVILEALASAPPGAAEGAGEGAAAAADASSPAREAGSGPAPAGAAGAGASAQAALGAWEWLLLRAYLRLGESYLSDDSDPGSGESVFAAAAARWPRCAAAWAGVARCCATWSGGFDASGSAGGAGADGRRQALATWREANLLDPQDGEVWAQLACAAFSTGDMAAGNAALESALALGALLRRDPEGALGAAPLDEARLLQDAAWGHASRGDSLAACRLLERALELGYDSFQVRHQLAKALVERREVASARLHAGEAAKLAQGEVEAQLLGELQRQLAGL